MMNYSYDDARQWDDDFEREPKVEDPATILHDCMIKFHSPDYILESGIFTQLMKYFRVGGRPEVVIELLSNNYAGIADTANVLVTWLMLSGFTKNEVQVMTENHLQEMIVKNFDPKKADNIFTLEGQTPPWLSEMIQHRTWRFLIYRLAEEYPECLMLNFIIRLIAYAGFQGEITSISVVAQQMDIFSIVMKTAISNCLNTSYDEQSKYIQECAKLACHGQHTYIYSSLLLYTISQEGKSACNIKRLYQEMTKAARKKHDVTAITMALHCAAKHPQISGALTSMLSRNSLNPADITVLYRNYVSMDPPPIEFIRNPQFLELLIDSLFKPGTKLNPEHKSKYIYLLAYASSVYEILSNKKIGSKKFTNQDEIQQTIEAIDKVHTICLSIHGSTELISELQTLFQYMKFPVVSIGIVRWVECIVTEPSYFKLCTEHTPTHLVLLDEIVSTHFLLQDMILHIIIDLFKIKHSDLDVLVQLEIKRMLIDRLVNLSCHGCVVPVIKFIDHLWKKTDTDISLIRYFVTEVLEKICPPYSLEFASLFLPIVENDEVTGTMRCGDGENDPVSEFIVHCKGMGL